MGITTGSAGILARNEVSTIRVSGWVKEVFITARVA
jgi:hypothetical protein